MAYTLWHCGVLIGETDFEEAGQHPRQRAGIFRPTPYGSQVFPRLSGMLTAAAEMKKEMERRGVAEDTEDRAVLHDLFEASDAGRKVVDIGRHLSEVELREPTGSAIEFKSIAFIDLDEVTRLSRELELDDVTSTLEALPPKAPQLIVSATFAGSNSEMASIGAER